MANSVVSRTRGRVGVAGFISDAGLRVVAQTTAFTAAASDHGAIYSLSAAPTLVATLPPTQKGLTFTFKVDVLTTAGAGHTVTPNASDKFLSNGKTDGQTLLCSSASDVLGDLITIVGDGVDGWHVTGKIGVWG